MSELGNDTNELLRKARQGTPALPPEVRRRLRGAVMTGAGLSTVAAGVSFAKAIAIGVVSASLGVVTTLAVTHHRSPPRTEVVAPPTRTEPPVAPPVIDPVPFVEVVTPTPPPIVPVTRRAEPRPVAVAPVAPLEVPDLSAMKPRVDDRSLAAELETLEGILRATDEKDWADARLRLGAYSSRFDDGHFRTEARALEVLTLCGENQVEAARALRRELLSVEPLNPAVLRLSTSCAAD